MSPTVCWIGLIKSFLICSLPNSKNLTFLLPYISPILSIHIWLPSRVHRFYKKHVIPSAWINFLHSYIWKTTSNVWGPSHFPDAFCAEVEAGALRECSMTDLLCLVTTVTPQVHGEPPSPRGTQGLNWVLFKMEIIIMPVSPPLLCYFEAEIIVYEL